MLVILILSSAIFFLRDTSQFELRGDDTIVSEEARYIKSDYDNNIVIAGYTQSDTFEFTIGQTRSGKSDIFVTKFDSSLNIIWSRLIGGSENDYISGMAIDSQNNIILSGSTVSTDFAGGDYTFEGMSDLFVQKLSSDGSMVFTQVFGSEGSYFDSSLNLEGINTLTVGTNDSIILGGYSFSSNILEPDRKVTYEWSHPYDIFLTQFNSDGQREWVTYQPATWDDELTAVHVVDDKILTMSCIDYEYYLHYQTGQPGDYIYDLEKSLEVKDILITQYSSDGEYVDGSIFGGAGYDCGSDILITTDSIYIAGITRSDDLYPEQRYYGGFSDIFLMSLDMNLAVKWIRTIGGRSIDGPSRDNTGVFLSLSGSNLVIATSTYSTDIPSSTSNSGEWDILLTLTDSSGEITDSYYYGGSSLDILQDMVMTSQSILVVGYTHSRSISTDGSTKEGFRDSFLIRFDGSGHLMEAIYL